MNRQQRRHPDRHGVKVCLGWCDPGEVSGDFAASVLQTQMADERLGAFIRYEGGPRVAESRNTIVDRFLFSDATKGFDWLWMVDADMSWTPADFAQLLASADKDERPIVGGLCFAAGKGDVYPTLYRLTADQEVEPVRDYGPGLNKVDATGAAFLLMHWSVLARMGEAFAELPNGVQNPYRWFVEGMASKTGKPMGEDIAFAIKANSLDIPIYVDARVKVGHRKAKTYTESDASNSFQPLVTSDLA